MTAQQLARYIIAVVQLWCLHLGSFANLVGHTVVSVVCVCVRARARVCVRARARARSHVHSCIHACRMMLSSELTVKVVLDLGSSF
jgi:hypothetical protein